MPGKGAFPCLCRGRAHRKTLCVRAHTSVNASQKACLSSVGVDVSGKDLGQEKGSLY